MAEGLQIQIGANVTSAVQGLNQVQAELDQTSKDASAFGNSVDKAAAKLRALPNVTGQATSTLTNFSRVVQDAPFGIIGIANNIDPLVQSFNQLKVSTGSATGAFKALIGQLAGPAGIALGISVVTSLLVKYGDKLFAASAASKELAEQSKKAAEAQKQIITQLGQERAEVDKLIILINNENTTRGQKEAILKKLQQISPQYFGDLKNEAGLVDSLTQAYKRYTASLVAKSEVATLTRQLDEISASILELEKQGATTEVIDLGLKQGLDGRLQVTKLLTREQTKQLTLNTQLSAQERERQRVLAEIAKRQGALADDLRIRPQDIKIKPEKVTLEPVKINIPKDAFDVPIEVPAEGIAIPVPNVTIDFLNLDVSKQLAQIKNKFAFFGLEIPPINVQAVIQNPEILDYLNEQLDVAYGKFRNVSDIVGGAMAPAFDGLFNSIEKGGDAIGGFFDGLAQGIQQLVQALIQTAAIAGLVSLITGTPFSSSFKLLSGITLPGRALGGPVSGGTPYLVGERGPELFVPSVSGGIVPNNAVGSFMGGRMGDSGRGTTLRGQDIILAYARTQRSQLRVNG
jgi:hypothetical protein